MLTSNALPYFTAVLPGIGGVIKQHDEDFQVEEIPLYQPSGEGTHVYFVVEKLGMTTQQVAREVGERLGIRARDVGYAGLKDAHALTKQLMSAEHVETEAVAGLSGRGWRVLSVARHTNKLRIGHLKGNRFRIKMRQAVRWDVSAAEAILSVGTRRGVPNYFDAQRFGARGDNAAIGLAALRGDFEEAFALMLGRPGELDRGPVREARARYDAGDLHAAARLWPHSLGEQRRACQALLRFKRDARRAWSSLDRRLVSLYLSAVQSALFNQVVVTRLAEIDRVRAGDLAWKHANGAVFRVIDETPEQPRCDAFEISPSGPLFGHRMTQPDGFPGELEARVLASAGLKLEDFGTQREARVEGARRPLRFRPLDTNLLAGEDAHGPYLEVSFTLDAGCYASILMREICK
ncbi:MAG TPA: tRNA pseudouridine(13) synthase TruD [Phycisphaerae bacterium]|jgi:tRNA pseudouridine13 synthase